LQQALRAVEKSAVREKLAALGELK